RRVAMRGLCTRRAGLHFQGPQRKMLKSCCSRRGRTRVKSVCTENGRVSTQKTMLLTAFMFMCTAIMVAIWFLFLVQGWKGRWLIYYGLVIPIFLEETIYLRQCSVEPSKLSFSERIWGNPPNAVLGLEFIDLV